MNHLILLSFAAAFCSAAVLPYNSTIAHIRNGTLIGTNAGGIDSFLGIPYAKPPVGQHRLRAPQAIDDALGTVTLPGSGDQVMACTNMDLTYFNLTAETNIPPDEQSGFYFPNTGFQGNAGEDCLTVNVQRPSGTLPGAKLPVLFWIYGGGWEIGTTQFYDGSVIVNQSITMNEPVVFVQFNYRLNAFGFLGGKQLQAEGSTNLGLRDQRKALEWVAENIEAFGGDPDRVTIWGESAGAASVFDHLIINNGDNTYNGKPLFHAAIMNSGSIIFSQTVASDKAQHVFDTMATYAGCPPTSFGCESDVLECLRNVSYGDFTAAMNLLPDFSTSRSNDLAYVRRPDLSSDFYSQFPEDALRLGSYARVPVIIGNLQDEATVFVPSQIRIVNDTQSLVTYIASWMTETPRQLVQALIDTYPADPAAGLPAETGSQYEIYPQSKRNAAVQTDLIFAVGRRIALSYMSLKVSTWSFLGTYQFGTPYWGTYHTSDLATEFGQEINTYAGVKMDEAYIHFVNYLNPNGEAGSVEAWWPEWDNENLILANFSANAVGLTKDDFRWASYEFWRDHASQMRV